MDDMEAQRDIEYSDRDLAEAVLHYGEEQAFRELYRRHTPRLLGFVGRLLGGTDAEAEDVAQDTWVRACQGLERFRWESTFSTWLLGIGLNIVRDHLRRHARTHILDIDDIPDPPGPMRIPDDRIDLERSIALLPDGYRMVLVLHDVEGMKHREIAEKLGISDGTTKSQLSKARKMLRGLLSKPRRD
ncbi:MAG: sigma-70 family RNA polymerase sigma factor [Candidatus Latescibacterota bacterium]|nr:MAG: sigma-70 family RNA polymerase sigma factor [Candidatus Latescibacterota bacterium]